uniref:AlNc14C272G9978 protein n=1 Tax=Albugo laibachii Nc14 TaxID=890382 RepID=F0WUG5_9STRA|nr:AlNc14C272G9978 [Albugo laibachii Nc14]|eukprot:CCA25045.1 AlNc14C272G9978 [Albugo laibachii Nc14]
MDGKWKSVEDESVLVRLSCMRFFDVENPGGTGEFFAAELWTTAESICNDSFYLLVTCRNIILLTIILSRASEGYIKMSLQSIR